MGGKGGGGGGGSEWTPAIGGRQGVGYRDPATGYWVEDGREYEMVYGNDGGSLEYRFIRDVPKPEEPKVAETPKAEEAAPPTPSPTEETVSDPLDTGVETTPEPVAQYWYGTGSPLRTAPQWGSSFRPQQDTTSATGRGSGRVFRGGG